MKKISVIIPIYNTEIYLERCLSSIINNTYKNLEIICINDGSSDHSIDLLHKFEGMDKRIIIIDKENEGLSSARNAGLEIATGDYISFVDSDDWIHKRFFEIMMNYAEETKCEMVMCNFLKTNQQNEPESIVDEGKISLQILTDTSIIFNNDIIGGCVWRYLYKRDIIEGVRFPRIQVEDGAFQLRVIAGNEGKLSLCRLICKNPCQPPYLKIDGSVLKDIWKKPQSVSVQR